MDLVSTSGIIIVEDSLANSGTTLLRSISKILADKGYRLVAVCDEMSTKLAREFFAFGENVDADVTAASDFFDSDSPAASCLDFEKYLNSKKSNKTAFVFDSLTQALIFYGAEKLVQILYALHFDENSEKSPILACLHSDCIPPDHVTLLKWLATTWYTVGADGTVECVILKNKKILRKTSKFEISDTFSLKFDPISVKREEQHPVVAPPSGNKKSNELLTFNVGIRDSEVSAKKSLVLPYIKDKSEKESGRIVYFPDIQDDIDEDDPDADLDI